MDGNNFENNLNNNVTPPNPTPDSVPNPAPEQPASTQPVISQPAEQPVDQPMINGQPESASMEAAMEAAMQEPAAAAEQQMAQAEKPKKNNKMTIILATVVGVLVIAVAAVLVVMNLPKSSSGNNSGNSGSGAVSDNTDEEEDEEPLENTELSAGTVTTTIGGQAVTYTAAYLVDGIEATIGSGTYESLADNQVVFLVANGGSLTIQGNVNISKTGAADFQGQGDDYSFYGMNSAIVVVGEGSTATINGATITTNASGANAVVATNGGAVDIQDASIATSLNGSRGLHATYGGTITADTVTIATQGGSSASLATDRGAGTVTATNMTLSTEGAGSPLIYSTGDITVSSSTGTANGAQIAVVEGKNSITLDGCNFSTNGIGNRNNVDNAAVMIYQSMSGDASVGKGSFTATDSTLTILPSSSVYTTAPFFFVTNTEAEITLTDVTASFYQDGYFVLASGTSEWGTVGSNGATVTVSATGLDATNENIGVDEISSVEGLE
ncbi:hypothetical protein IJG90_01740 [Candidatus Saccharibacteria bacterium]|nr:hypothetical protein [Candidatus Saccharibacteria bacterium]